MKHLLSYVFQIATSPKLARRHHTCSSVIGRRRLAHDKLVNYGMGIHELNIYFARLGEKELRWQRLLVRLSHKGVEGRMSDV
jgi:hypothetical protein